MTSADTSLSNPAALAYEAPPARRRGALSRLLAARGVWALGDQGICSVGTFLVNLALVRNLALHDYGVYALIFYYVLVFLNTIHGSLVTYPLTLEGATAGHAHLRRLVRRGLWFTLALAPALSLVIALAAWRLERMTILPSAVAAMVLWQFQETLRRALLAKLRHGAAIPGDAIRYLGQAAAVFFVVKHGLLDPEAALWSVAAASGVAAGVQLGQLYWMTRPDPADAGVIHPTFAAEAMAWWRSGRWLALTCLVNVGTIYLTPWVLEAAHGEHEVAALNALNTLLNLTNPIVFGVAGLIVPAVAAARASGADARAGLDAAKAVTVRYSLLGLVLLLPYYAVVLVAPGFVLRLFYGADSPYLHLSFEMPFVVIVYAALFAAYMSVSLLNGLGEGRASFVATLTSSVVTVVLVVPLAVRFGLIGSLAGSIVPIVAQTVVALWMVRRLGRLADRADAASRPAGGTGTRAAAAVTTDVADDLPPGGRRRLRVLVSAYAVSPDRGSEPGVGWGFCSRLAAHHDVTVLCAAGAPGHEHDVYRREVEAHLTAHGPIPGLTFVYVDRPLLSRLFQGENELSRRTLYYLGYNAWQRAAKRVAARLHADRPFDVVHQLSMTGFREPGYLWQLDAPFVWGPIAGASNIPAPFLRAMTWVDRVYYGLRNRTTSLQMRFAWRCRKAARRAGHIWTIGHASRDLVERTWGFPTETLVESGATPRPDATVRDYDGARPLRLVWSSLHIGRKALPLLLDAMARVKADEATGGRRVDLTVLGSGQLERAWRRQAARLGLDDRVRFLGSMPRAAALAEVDRADAMAFTSIQDGTPQAVLEALSLGLPVVCHDCCGMGVVVDDTCGIKVPLLDPETSAAGFADAIRRLAADPSLVAALSLGAILRTTELDWARMAGRVARVYDRVARAAAAAPARAAAVTTAVATTAAEVEAQR